VSDAVAALDYAVANGARISNTSWGGPQRSLALEAAITRAEAAGHLVVAAAGNAGQDADLYPIYPAASDGANIVSVAASDHDDRLAPYSNYGRRSVDLAAPGDGIISTLPGRSYGLLSGTSMATPHVTGAAALLWGRRPAWSLSRVKSRLIRRVDRKPTLASTVGGGRLNVRRALGPPTRPRLTLTRRPAVVTHGGTVTLRGRLTVGRSALAGRRVVLQQRPVGTQRWRRVPGGVRVTTERGSFRRAGLRPRRHTDYRVRFAGAAPSLASAWSPIRRARVRTRVTISASSRPLALGSARTIAGTVRPVHAGTVRLVMARNGRVAWRTQLDLTDSRYRFRFRPARTGRFTVHVVHPGDREHLRGRSPYRSFRVVR
jgi:thermitase